MGSVSNIFYVLPAHTPPVLKIVDRSGNETFGSIHIQDNLSPAPGTRPGPTLGGVTKVYIFALSHSNFPRGHDGRVKCERRGAEPDTFGISTPPGLLPVKRMMMPSSL